MPHNVIFMLSRFTKTQCEYEEITHIFIILV